MGGNLARTGPQLSLEGTTDELKFARQQKQSPQGGSGSN